MPTFDSLTGLRRRCSTCESCGAGFVATSCISAFQECDDCIKTRTEPPDEDSYDWRQEYYKAVIQPYERVLDEEERRAARANTR